MMKKIIIANLITFIALTSCNNDKKYQDNIIGTYYYTTTEEDIENSLITAEISETYNHNGKQYTSAKINVSFYDNYDSKQTLNFDLFVVANYKIKDGIIIYDFDLDKIKLTPAKDNYVYNRKLKKYIEDHLIPKFKEVMINHKGSKIIELSETKLVTETNGERIIYKKK